MEFWHPWFLCHIFLWLYAGSKLWRFPGTGVIRENGQTQGEDIFHDHFFLSEKIWKPHPQPFIDEWRMICTKNVRIYHFWEPIPLFFHSSSPLEVYTGDHYV